ncbi:MAG: transcriptional regulator [Rhodobacteraceae bacterium]|nr:MAG: transcriptional regulator [Paracoccaceae bacterium]
MRPTRQDTPQATALNLYLIGPMRITDAQGQKIVVRGRKAQALLALTALGPQMRRSRIWLRDKLWSNSDEARSSTSLRQSLFELRRDLGEVGQTALEISADTVALNPAMVWVDLLALQRDATLMRTLGLTEDSELLEGFDIGDPEFEDWLQGARFDWSDQAEALAARQLPVAGHLLVAGGRPAAAPVRIGLMRSVVHGGDELSAHLSDQLLERIIGNLRDLMPVRVLDLRNDMAPIEDLAESAEAEFFVRMRVLCVGRKVTLTFFLFRASQLALEWSQAIQCSMDELQDSDALLLLGFVAQNVDRLCRTIQTGATGADPAISAQLAGHSALNMLFRLDDDAVDRAITLIDKAETLQASQACQHSLPGALRVYAASFAVGENLGVLSDAALRELRDVTNMRLGENPFNSMSLACLGHVIGYVLGQHELAGKVLERAVSQNPAQPFAWDHLALHKLYVGDYDAALRHAYRATQLGAFSPMSYSYDTTLAMAATLSGDYGRAVLAGRAALQKQPRFKAAMRYLMIAQSASGQRDAAEATRGQLLQLDPDFGDPEVQRRRFGLQPGAHAHSLLRLLKPIME